MAAEILKDIYLFNDLQAKELEQLSALGQARTFNRDEQIFDEGDKAQSLYVIRHGTVHIRRSGKDDNVEVAQLGTGAHFGEMSFVDNEPRSATALAMEHTELLEIAFDDLHAYFAQHPEVAVKFYRSLSHFLCGRLRVTTMDLSFSREKNIRHF